MGWASATPLFDGVVRVSLEMLHKYRFQDSDSDDGVPESIIYDVVKKLYQDIGWEDWDTQCESDFSEYLDRVRLEMGEISICSSCKVPCFDDRPCYG